MATSAMQFKMSCLKTLTAVEADRNRSNQHEFQGVAALKSIFGRQRLSCSAHFSIRGQEGLSSAGLTWYDSREKKDHRSPEFRLYFQSNAVMDIAQEGDTIVIGLDQNDNIHCELIRNGSVDYVRYSHWSTK
ncbi:hypothetical protein [Shewanella benthica]|uniref:hypothetical protein n=1 Tax=Shewanella benthica TaxID=43661 RepID=UPI00058DA182|nr:hypothetical protein [Shewanella benthica]